VIARKDRLTVKEAAEILGRTEKAVHQLIQRKSNDGIGLQSELDKATGRRHTTRAWIEEYLEEGRVPQAQRDEYDQTGRISPRSKPVLQVETPGRTPTTREPTSVPEIIEELERLLARLRAVLVGR
jgi:predicted transcriptional regulator